MLRKYYCHITVPFIGVTVKTIIKKKKTNIDKSFNFYVVADNKESARLKAITKVLKQIEEEEKRYFGKRERGQRYWFFDSWDNSEVLHIDWYTGRRDSAEWVIEIVNSYWYKDRSIKECLEELTVDEFVQCFGENFQNIL